MSPSRSVTTKRATPGFGGPSDHSLYAKRLRRRGRFERFVKLRSDSLTGSSRATKTASSCAMPRVALSQRVTPGAWRTTQRGERGVRLSGAGVAPQKAPLSSSRRKMASAVGSVTGSFANGVRRFWPLFSHQVWAAPELVTMLPKPGFARTLTQGSGVSRSPSRTTTYSRPSRVKPPSPFSMTSVGLDRASALRYPETHQRSGP